MGKTLKDRHDNDDFFSDIDELSDDNDFDFEDDELSPQYASRYSRVVEHSDSSEAMPKRKRRPEMWEDDWTDPADDLMHGYSEY